MPKILKSVRIDENVLDVTQQYLDFLKDTMGISLNFSEIANEAMALYLWEKTSKYNEIMHERKIAITKPNGNLKFIEFTAEQLKAIENLNKTAEGLANTLD
ncbi:MAG: hypothetical protein IKL44_06325 [Clostridia bacterium]|nr:hypothetical protein [Clostridia bacterium]